MSKVNYFRDPELPYLEIKSCDNAVHSSKKHSHPELSMGIVLKGSSLVECERESFIVSRGTMICIPPEIIHKCSPHDTQNWSFHMLYLKAQWVEASFGVCLTSLPTFASELDDENFSRVRKLCTFLQQKHFTAMEKESFLLSEMEHFLSIDKYISDSMKEHQNDPSSVSIALDFINDNFLEKISLDDLCKVSGLSKYYLIRAFESFYKLSPHSYLTMVRINYAKKELLKSRQITDVAAEAGFYDQSHFVKVFRQYAGTTPIKYIKGI